MAGNSYPTMRMIWCAPKTWCSTSSRCRMAKACKTKTSSTSTWCGSSATSAKPFCSTAATQGCVSVLASRFLLGLATPTHRLARVSHFASCPCPASPAAFACRRHWLARSCPCPAVSASQPGHVCVFVCGCTCGMQMRDRGGGGKDRRKDDEARVLCLCCR